MLAPLAPSGSFGSMVLTPDGLGTYRSKMDTDGTVRISPEATTSGTNRRWIMWDTAATTARDGGACETWAARHGTRAQPGVVLRVKVGPGYRVRAILVSKNVFWGYPGDVNVHVYDSTAHPALRTVGQLDVPAVDETRAAVAGRAIHFCARVVADQVQVKAWTEGGEPTWSSVPSTQSVTLPAGWDEEGLMGWYAGHLGPGDSVDYRDLRWWLGTDER